MRKPNGWTEPSGAALPRLESITENALRKDRCWEKSGQKLFRHTPCYFRDLLPTVISGREGDDAMTFFA